MADRQALPRLSTITRRCGRALTSSFVQGRQAARFALTREVIDSPPVAGPSSRDQLPNHQVATAGRHPEEPHFDYCHDFSNDNLRY
jgi:hypothetical protein